MNAHLVPDTSVVIKWFRQGEILAEKALALRAAYLAGHVRVSVPNLLAYELTNVLRYKEVLTTVWVEEAVSWNMSSTWPGCSSCASWTPRKASGRKKPGSTGGPTRASWTATCAGSTGAGLGCLP